MLTQHLDYRDFQLVGRLCRVVDLRRLPTDFDFKQYLLRVLGPRNPAAANVVDHLTDGEIQLLRSELEEFQALSS